MRRESVSLNEHYSFYMAEGAKVLGALGTAGLGYIELKTGMQQGGTYGGMQAVMRIEANGAMYVRKTTDYGQTWSSWSVIHSW